MKTEICTLCDTPILETGSSFNGLPCHISCFHLANDIKNHEPPYKHVLSDAQKESLRLMAEKHLAKRPIDTTLYVEDARLLAHYINENRIGQGSGKNIFIAAIDELKRLRAFSESPVTGGEVFRSNWFPKDNTKSVWLFWYTDANGLNQHSGIYFTEADAIKGLSDFNKSVTTEEPSTSTAEGSEVLCCQCNKPINETGTALGGKPCHITCFYHAKLYEKYPGESDNDTKDLIIHGITEGAEQWKQEAADWKRKYEELKSGSEMYTREQMEAIKEKLELVLREPDEKFKEIEIKDLLKRVNNVLSLSPQPVSEKGVPKVCCEGVCDGLCERIGGVMYSIVCPLPPSVSEGKEEKPIRKETHYCRHCDFSCTDEHDMLTHESRQHQIYR